MNKQNIILHNMKDGGVRTVIKSRHGRQIYLELDKNGGHYTARMCFYLDRIRGGEYYAAPQKFVTTEFAEDDILNVVATELDRRYFGVEYIDDSVELTENEFIEKELNLMKRRYKFLIFVGEGEHINGLPSTLTTRLANTLHRKIYFKIRYYKNGIGVIEDCHYFDRQYKERTKVIPQMLTTVFVEYNRGEILSMINRELACDFTDIIIADNSIDLENNLVAICGNI